jgi:methyl-accepting chemotaxis protein
MFKLRVDSISKKFTFVVFFLLIFLLIITGTVIFIIEKNDALKKQYIIGNNLVKHIGYALENWVFDQIRIAKTIAINEDIIALSKNPGDENLRQKVKRKLLKIHSIYEQAEAIDICPKLKNGERITKIINGKVINISSGQILVSTVGEHVVGLGGQDHAMAVVDGGKDYSISEVYPSFTNGKPIFVITVPVKDAGEIGGAVAFVIKIKFFSNRFLQGNKVGKIGYLFMIDDRGALIAHPNEKLIMSKNEIGALSAIDRKVIEKKKQFYETFGKQYRLYITYKIAIPLEHVENEWFLIFGQNVNEILKGPYKFLKILTAIGIVFLILIMSLLTFLAVTAFDRPLNKVIYALRDISESEGDLTQSLNIKSKDEIGGLARYFDNFTIQLRGLIKSIMTKFLNTKDRNDALQATIKDFSTVISNQSAKLASVTSSIDMVHSNAIEVLGNVKAARENAAKGAESAVDGEKILSELVTNISKVDNNT